MKKKIDALIPRIPNLSLYDVFAPAPAVADPPPAEEVLPVPVAAAVPTTAASATEPGWRSPLLSPAPAADAPPVAILAPAPMLVPSSTSATSATSASPQQKDDGSPRRSHAPATPVTKAEGEMDPLEAEESASPLKPPAPFAPSDLGTLQLPQRGHTHASPSSDVRGRVVPVRMGPCGCCRPWLRGALWGRRRTRVRLGVSEVAGFDAAVAHGPLRKREPMGENQGSAVRPALIVRCTSGRRFALCFCCWWR